MFHRHRSTATLAITAFGLALFTAIPVANADLLPHPERPTWDQEPLPEPEPPPEKPLERALVAGLGFGLLALALAVARGRAWPASTRPSAPHDSPPGGPAGEVP